MRQLPRTRPDAGPNSTWLIGLVLLAVLAAAMPGQAADPAAGSGDDAVMLPLVNQALEEAPTGVELQWSNPATGNKGVIVVVRTVSTAPDRPCREYRRTRARPEAPVETIEGVGCRVGPGVWELDETAAEAGGEAGQPGGRERAAGPPERCPAIDPGMVVHVPCTRPGPFVSFTMPAKGSY